MYSALRILLTLLAIVAGLWSRPTPAAQGSCKSVSAECVAVGELDVGFSVGFGTRTNPVRGRSDIPLYVIPQISYYGKRFFLQNLEPGFTLHEGASHTFNLIATPGYDRVFFSRNDPQNVFASDTGFGPLAQPPPPTTPADPRVPRRRSTYLAGPEWLFTGGALTAQLNALYEVTGRHDGYEVRGALSAPLLQTEQSLVVSAGGTWKSWQNVDYYYGIPRIYRARAAFNPFVKLAFALPLSQRWAFGGFIHYERLDEAIVDSPIVSGRNVVTAFAGFTFNVL